MRAEANRIHDVFLSYSSKDKTWADAACAVLRTIASAAGSLRETSSLVTNGAPQSWIAARESDDGADFLGHANASPQVRREVERAISQGMIVLPVRVEDVRPEGAMEFSLGNTHWLDAFTPPVERQLELLARSVIRFLATKLSRRPLRRGNAMRPLVPIAPGVARNWRH